MYAHLIVSFVHKYILVLLVKITPNVPKLRGTDFILAASLALVASGKTPD